MKICKISSISKITYVGVIILFISFFLNNNKVYRYNLDGLHVSETSTSELPLLPKKVISVDISYKGISFFISRKSPLILISQDKVVRQSKVIDVIIEEDRLLLKLENEITLNVRVDNYGERLTINSTIPKVFPTIKEISIPYKLDSSSKVIKGDLSYMIKGLDDEFHLKLNDLYYMDSSTHRIHLLSQEDKISTLTFSPLSSSDLPLAEQWYKTYKPDLEISQKDQIQQYLNNIEKSISSVFNPIRFDSETEAWGNIPRSSLYTENSVIVYLAQGMRDKTYTARVNRIKEIQSRDPSQFTFASTPFLGNIVVNGQNGIDQYNKELLEIKNFIRSKDDRLFSTWIPEYYFKGNEIDLTQLENSLKDINPRKMSLNALGTTLHNLLNISNLENNSSKTTDRVKEISDLIIEKIMWDYTGLYLVEDDGRSYMELNLKIGKLLIEASQHESSKYSKPIGETLIKTYLDNSDEKGSVYRSYNIKDRTASQDKIKPEDSYLAISDNPYLPHYYYDKGIKVWTISDSVVITRSSKETKITFTYPIDYLSDINSHFLTITGIEPYELLYFNGRQWRADRSFEKWGIGYYYSPETKLLFFMPNHTKLREEIVVTY